MHNFFVWVLLISGLIFSVAGVTIAITGKIPRGEMWRYALIGLGCIMICALIGAIFTF